MSEWVLTGKRRYRAVRTSMGNDFVVLQVELRWSNDLAPEQFKWRDATFEDLTVHNKDEKLDGKNYS